MKKGENRAGFHAKFPLAPFARAAKDCGTRKFGLLPTNCGRLNQQLRAKSGQFQAGYGLR